MTDQDYRRALEAASREFEELGAKRQDIDKRLAELAQTIGTLMRLLGLTPTVPLGLTDAVRLVVRGGGVPMTPIEVRDRLHGMGFDLSKYANDLAAVHTILKRLNESGELRFIARAAGKHQYMLNRASTPIVLTPDVVKHLRDNTLEHEALHAAPDRVEPAAPRGGKKGGPRRRIPR
jgi:hypothetical protein